jgi:hypothetical protein
MNRRETPDAMLMMTANWAVSDGSLADPGAGRAVAWLEAIRRSVVRSGCGRDGRYRPVAEVTLIFAGDTFDWLLSDAWAGRHKPWHAAREASELRARVAWATLLAARPAARTLLRWGTRGLAVPAADARGRPSGWGVTNAMVRIVLLAGDRDRWLVGFSPLDRRGLSAGEAWSDGRVSIRHGHDLDPLTHVAAPVPIAGERAPTLGESIAVDLLVPFAVAARDDSGLWPALRPALGRLAAARPAMMPAQLEKVIGKAIVAAGVGGPMSGRIRSRAESLWREHVARWHRVARRDAVACEAEFDGLESLAAWLERLEPGGGCPSAVARLDPPPASSSRRRNELVAHPPPPTGPVLTCCLAGRTWCEPLAPRPSDRGIVTIGANDGGGRFVDAA